MDGSPGGGGRVIVPAEQLEAAKHMAEVRAGLRCAACGERFEHGVQCIVVRQSWAPDGEPVIQVITPSVCGRCDDSGGVMRDAVAMREVRQRFLRDGLPEPLRPAERSTATPQDPIDGGPDLG